MRGRVVALGAVVVAAVAVVGWTLSRPAHNAATSSRTGASPSATTAAPDNNGHDAATALARLAADPASLVAAGAQPQVGGGARQGVPAGSVVAVAERSWAPDGIGGGTMTVTVTPPGGAAVTYAAVMELETTGWKVLATVPLAGS